MSASLVIGADATIGATLLRKLRSLDQTAYGTSRGATSDIRLDLTASESWPEFPQADVAYICAAVSKLDACERDPKEAARVNVEGTSLLAKRLSDCGIFPIFLSSNHVFDGTKPHRKPGDPLAPINEYGRQKMLAEKAVLEAKGAVLRLTKVIVKGDPRITSWHEMLKQEHEVTAFDDIYLAPLTLDNVHEAMMMVGEAKKPGIYQISGEEDFSYYDLACGIAKHLGVDTSLVKHDSGAKAGIPEPFRPRYSSYEQALPSPVLVPDKQGIIAYALS